MRFIHIVFMFFIALFLAGCPASKGKFTLQNPEFQNYQNINSAKGVVFIASVNDKREFEDTPKNASIPSVHNRQVESLNAKEKDKYIARKRNSYGKAMENIILDGNQTVTNLVKTSVARAFANNGFYVLNDEKQINQNTIILKVDVLKFWSFFRPGFWSVAVNTHIKSDVSTGSKNITTDVDHMEKFQMVLDRDYQKVTNDALRIYEKQLTDKIAQEFK